MLTWTKRKGLHVQVDENNKSRPQFLREFFEEHEECPDCGLSEDNHRVDEVEGQWKLICIIPEPTEPEEGDYIIWSSGPLGSHIMISVAGDCEGCFVDGNRHMEWEEIVAVIRADAEKHQVWPNVWSQSDHGNNHLITDWKWQDDDSTKN